MMNLLMANLADVITFIVIILLIYIGLRSRYKSQVAGYILEYIRLAEDTYGGGTGVIKKSAVFGIVYDMLPSLAKLILSKDLIGKLIDDAAAEFTKYLESLSDDQKGRLLPEVTENDKR